jgi:hypothetical protein
MMAGFLSVGEIAILILLVTTATFYAVANRNLPSGLTFSAKGPG